MIIISTLLSKTQNYMSVVTLSARDNQKLSNFLSKGFERSVYWNEYKTKVRIKIRPTNLDIFSNIFLLESTDYVLVYSNQGADPKRFEAKKHY